MQIYVRLRNWGRQIVPAEPLRLGKPSNFTASRFDDVGMRAGGCFRCFILLALAGAGCHAPVTIYRNGQAAPSFATPEALVPTSPAKIEPDYSKLPAANAAVAKEAYAYRGLDERTAQCLAVSNASLANLLDAENSRASVLGTIKRRGTVNAAGDDLLREMRKYASIDARNRAAADALERYLQLADAEGRDELFAMGIAVLEKLRELGPSLREAQLPVPHDDDLARQHAKMLADRESLEALIGQINHDLKAKLGATLEPGERFWPKDDFGMWSDAIDVEAAVKYAVANRADLQLLRILQERLNTDTLPSVQEAMKSLTPLVAPVMATRPSVFTKLKSLCGMQPVDPMALAEVESRKQQIAELIISREREVAAQVRTSASQLASAAKRVAVLRNRSESLGGKLAKAKSEKKLADILMLESEHLKARVDVLAAVFEWHQWRVKLKATQGLLVTECQQGSLPAAIGPGPGIVPLKVSRR